ncbi:MAG: cytochrome c oxidase subunit II [Planctomycetota bacterium]|nr:cytochrome c oxidase subunit II [Planctomycetota bacterium]
MILASRDIIDSVDKAWWILTGISVVLFIGIMTALVIFAIKYHRSRNPRAADISGNTKLEIAWTVLPTLLSVYMFFVGYEGFALMRDMPSEENSIVVEVDARQWAFTFRYPNADISSPDMYVPVGKPIRCHLTAPDDDVIHSFYIPYFRTKEDCVPGRTNYMWFQADKIGVYNIFCAEYCGKDHARMVSKLHVVSEEDYRKWLTQRLEDRFRPIDDVAAVMDAKSEGIVASNAAELYTVYCASCHGPKGEGGLVEGARSFIDNATDKWKKGVTIPDMFRTLTLGLDGTRMKAFDNLSAWDRFALAHHVASLHPDGPGRSDAPIEEYKKLIDEFKLAEQKKVSLDFPVDEAIEELVEKTGSEKNK